MALLENYVNLDTGLYLLRSFETHNSFWEENKHLIPYFSSFYEADESLRKTDSSEIMWAISLYCHPSSPYFQLSEKEKIQFIQEDFMKGKNFKLEDYSDEIRLFKQGCLLREERFLANLAKKLDERDDYFNNLPYSESNIDLLEKLFKNFKDITKQYLDIKQLLEDTKQHAEGSVVESASELGEI